MRCHNLITLLYWRQWTFSVSTAPCFGDQSQELLDRIRSRYGQPMQFKKYQTCCNVPPYCGHVLQAGSTFINNLVTLE